MPRAIIVGGGISGLATAFYLKRAGGVDVLLVEGEPRLGGTLGSELHEGYVFERGANGFLDNVPHALDLVRDLGLGERLLRSGPLAKDRFIYRRGKLHALPSSPIGFLRSSLLSLRGRLRVLTEPFRKRAADGQEDSVAAFGRRRLGDEAVRALLDPMVTGIHAADVERLSLPSAFPRIAQLEREHGSLVRAMFALRRARRAETAAKGDQPAGAPGESAATPPRARAGPAGPGGDLCSFPGGLQEMVDAIEAALGGSVRRSWKAARVVRQGKQIVLESSSGQRETADAVVVALPSYRAASLLAPAAAEAARALEAIPYAPIAVACFGFPRGAIAHGLGGFGFLVPRDQGLRLLGSIWVSSIFPQHAPPGHVSLRCMIGGARDPDALNLSDSMLADLILEELRPILGIRALPAAQRIFRYSRGIPQYNVGHAGRIDRVERALWDLPGIFLTGNAYYGIGINDCVKEGQRKARAVREHVGLATPPARADAPPPRADAPLADDGDRQMR